MGAWVFVTHERRMWMRRGDHTVVFDRDPNFFRFAKDPSGSVMRILRVWIADEAADSPQIRHYIGSVRRWERGGWMSHRELIRLFRRATIAARLLGESLVGFRVRLSEFLRGYFSDDKDRASGNRAG